MELGAKKVHMNLNKKKASSSSLLRRKPLPTSIFTSSCDEIDNDERSTQGNCNPFYSANGDQNDDYNDFDLTTLPTTSSSSSSSSSYCTIVGQENGDMPYSEVLRYLTFSNPYAGKTEIQGR